MEDVWTLNVLCSRSECDTCHFAIRFAVCLPNRYGLVFFSYISSNKAEVYAQCFVSSPERIALHLRTVAKEDYCMGIIRKLRWIRTHESEFWEVNWMLYICSQGSIADCTMWYHWCQYIFENGSVPTVYKSEGSRLCPITTKKNRWWV